MIGCAHCQLEFLVHNETSHEYINPFLPGLVFWLRKVALCFGKTRTTGKTEIDQGRARHQLEVYALPRESPGMVLTICPVDVHPIGH